MKLGLELIAVRPVVLRLGTFFETWIATPSGTIRRSLGRDEYHLELSIAGGHRLTGTGRTHICQLDLEAAGLGANQARPTTPVEADIQPGTPVIWGIRTNLFLSLPDLADRSRAMLHLGGESRPFRLDHPHVPTDEIAPGRYVLDISALLLETRPGKDQ